MHTPANRATLDIPNLDLKLALISGLLWVLVACLELYKCIIAGGANEKNQTAVFALRALHHH